MSSEFLKSGYGCVGEHTLCLLEGPGRDEGPAKSGDRSCSGAWMFSLMGEHFLLSHVGMERKIPSSGQGCVFVKTVPERSA